MNTSSNHWLALDFGSTNSRLWRMCGVSAEAEHRDIGLRGLARADFPAFITRIRADLNAHDLPMIACGMIGSRQGWQEAPYISLPALKQLAQHCRQADAYTWIVPGIAQHQPHYDVMRGEETQLLGAHYSHPDWQGNLVLPGTHSKWITRDTVGNQIFSTYTTGETYRAFAEHSLLAPLMHAQGNAGFAEGVAASQQQPIATQALFGLRARALLAADVTVSEYLSGYLIGLEFVGKNSAEALLLIADATLAERYQRCAALLGFTVQVLSADQATRAGLYDIARQLLPYLGE